ncbi:hypothetical protein NP233_g6523 [Leucocoprinus birnbaumii]|uniref:Uncharacterized protein n=1 Tax=Leucocoprinus birnbaumii TaxID=56174 RepID=A0AAD5VT68_9AGAR|nr:hypothetical protein NP233_g6523 [Leucocoprinus birnbaumii]
MSSNSTSIDYGEAFGIHSVPAAAIFAIIYAPLLVYYIFRLVTKFNYVFIVMTLFCLFRTVGFVIRAVVAGSTSAGSNLSLVIADQVLFGIGFSGLLFATFSLQNDRERVAGLHYKTPPMSILTNGRIFHLVVAGSVALLVVGTSKLTSHGPGDQSTGNTLRTAGTWVLFGATLIPGIRAGAFMYLKSTKYQHVGMKMNSFVDQNAAAILCVITALLVERMVYSVITVGMQASEASYYPLSALPEFLVVCVFATPGLVLSRTELQEQDVILEGYRPNERLYDPHTQIHA